MLPAKLDKPSNRADKTEGEPNVMLDTGEPMSLITMADDEGFEMDGSDTLDAAYPDEPPAIDPAGTDETIIHIWSAVAAKAKRCRTTK